MSAIRWLDTKPFGQQIIILTAVLDPIGAALGWFLAPEFGIDPIMGAVFGLVLAGIPTMLWILRYNQKHGE